MPWAQAAPTPERCCEQRVMPLEAPDAAKGPFSPGCVCSASTTINQKPALCKILVQVVSAPARHRESRQASVIKQERPA